jgi:adenylylsulfate kinase
MSSEKKSTNVVWHHAAVDRQKREAMNGHKSAILWFTGLSGSGKSTLSHAVEERLHALQCRTFVLDGDNIRHGLCNDLGFSDEDRVENIRRIGEVSKLFIEAGMIVMTAFISPFRADRARVRSLVADGDFIEIYCKASLEICEQRDVKGLYKKARAGEIKAFTGITSPYEAPNTPEITVETGDDSLDKCTNQVITLLRERGILKK